MESTSEPQLGRGVLVVVTDAAWRRQLERACRAAGVRIRAVSGVEDVVRWPEGEIVVTDAANLSLLWQQVGAVEVIALVGTAEEGHAAVDAGATHWLQLDSSVDDVIAALRSYIHDVDEQPHSTSEPRAIAEGELHSGAERLDALDEFLAEGEQPDSTIGVRPAKDRRHSRRDDRSGTSKPAIAAGALIIVLGTAAFFAAFKYSAPVVGDDRPSTAAPPASATVQPVEPGPPPEILEKVESQPAVSSRLSGQDLTGSWAMTNQVQASRYRPYQGLRIGYRLQLRQDGNRVSGDGQKWLENGRAIPRASRTPINVAGVVEGRRLALTFSERGRRRPSRGTFDLEMSSDGVLRGMFESDVAASRGSSVAQRVRIDEVGAARPR
jgi:ActR/RegA family two-component response regulator